nr:hypothetical protein [Cellulomonas bogoriensis]
MLDGRVTLTPGVFGDSDRAGSGVVLGDTDSLENHGFQVTCTVLQGTISELQIAQRPCRIHFDRHLTARRAARPAHGSDRLLGLPRLLGATLRRGDVLLDARQDVVRVVI